MNNAANNMANKNCRVYKQIGTDDGDSFVFELARPTYIEYIHANG